jgi:hypothetical protein
MSGPSIQQTADEVIGNTKSGRKLAKKARQIYRRDVQKTAREQAKVIGNILKPKPKWIPMGVWAWMMGFFIYIKK